YDIVRQIKHDFQHLAIILNGGIKTIDTGENEMHYVDGVMIGRAAYHSPCLLHERSQYLLAGQPLLSQVDVVGNMLDYIREQVSRGVSVHHITRHMLGLFQGMQGAVKWRRHLSTEAPKRPMDIGLVNEALAFVV